MKTLFNFCVLICLLFAVSKGEEELFLEKQPLEMLQSAFISPLPIMKPTHGIYSRTNDFTNSFVEVGRKILLLITVFAAYGGGHSTKSVQTKNMLTLVLCLVTSFVNVYATSDSNPENVYLCNALSPLWGCEPQFWTNDDRLKCQNTSQIMSWATKTSRSNCYRLSAGNEGSSISVYTPNQYININLQTNCFEKQYRGILLYAVNSTEHKVGEFTAPAQVTASLFKVPWRDPASPCYGSIMHSSSEKKPLSVTFNFKAPPVGTGRITFRCLIKYGGPNTGDFYWPNLEGDLTLREGSVSTSFISWERSDVGESCTSRCSKISATCDEPTLLSMNENILRNQVAASKPCELPYVSGCGELGSAYNPSLGLCYYIESNCTGRDAVNVTCNTTYSDMARNCPCFSNITSSPSSGDELIQTSGSNRITGISSMLLLIPLFFGISPRTYFMMLIVLLAFTQGHNWINSPARTGWPPAGVRPCKAQTSLFPHAQIGPGQTFDIEWSNGHWATAWFVTVHEDNFNMLYLTDDKLLQDYIDGAPSGSNRAMDPKYMRYSRKRSPDTNFYRADMNFISYPTANFYTEVIPPTDSRFSPRSQFFDGFVEGGLRNLTVHQLRYNNNTLSGDRLISYNSTKYPWIIEVRRYEIVRRSVQYFQPDFARFDVPAGSKPGRYIVQYLWGGYYDCIDFDYKPTQVENIYGVPANGIHWKRIDHCMFRDPQNVLSKHSEVIDSPQYCLGWAVSRDWDGVNVVPLKAPSTVARGIQPGVNETWTRPDIYGFDFYVPWRFSAVNSSRDQYAAIASENRYMCYGLKSRELTQSESEYDITDDPQNPIYYSTCYLKHRYRYIFPEYAISYRESFASGPWRVGKKCLDCESKPRTEDMTIFPRWEMADKCVDCDREKAENISTVPIVLQSGTKCDGYLNQTANANSTTCNLATTSCVKQLIAVGRDNTALSISECRIIASIDSECSNVYMYTTGRRCFCYKKLECCKTCSRVADTTVTTYETSSIPDPTCITGVLSANNSTCCSASCGVGNCVPNGRGVGFCCSTCVTRPCSQFGPPCKVF